MDESIYKDFFAGKRVTLMGLGVLGRGAGDAEFIAPLCKELIVTDKKTEAELRGSLERLKTFTNITYRLGEHVEEDFTNTDMVLKAAGVPMDSPYIAKALAAGVPVYMSTALFAKFAREAGATLVGITGTRGKSTTTHLIFEALKRTGRQAKLGGNVRGISTLAMLPEVKAGEVIVLELDSWQLQGFGDLGISPQVAVFTNLMPDHLNYYGEMDAYFADKANIFKHQKEGDHLIVGPSVAERVLASGSPVTPVVSKPLSPEWHLEMVGAHNRENASLARDALMVLGLSEEETRAALASIGPVEGRLQHLATIEGVEIYNDNNATTPEATLAALRAFSKEKRIVLIVGGADKNISLEELAHEIEGRAGAVVLLPGTGTERLKSMLTKFQEATNMQEAVTMAVHEAQTGDIILLSPGFASFGLFVNEYDRNDQFVAAVKKFQK